MNLMNVPLLVLAFSCMLLWLAAEIGAGFRSRATPLKEDERDDFGLVLSSTLTLLGLLIGFSFSMGLSRYDQRKDYEEAEANAIGTEYVRVELLPPEAASKTRRLLKEYLQERVLFYQTGDANRLADINRRTGELQNALWTAVVPSVAAEPTNPMALVMSGMNDVLNSQGYTQAAWLNRIPIAAWGLMALVACSCNFLVGYRARRKDWRIFVILPITVSIAFFLISDLDSPNGGGIRVAPQNLLLLSRSLQ